MVLVFSLTRGKGRLELVNAYMVRTTAPCHCHFEPGVAAVSFLDKGIRSSLGVHGVQTTIYTKVLGLRWELTFLCSSEPPVRFRAAVSSPRCAKSSDEAKQPNLEKSTHCLGSFCPGSGLSRSGPSQGLPPIPHCCGVAAPGVAQHGSVFRGGFIGVCVLSMSLDAPMGSGVTT